MIKGVDCIMEFLRLSYNILLVALPSCKQMNSVNEFLEGRVFRSLSDSCVSGTCRQWTVCGL